MSDESRDRGSSQNVGLAELQDALATLPARQRAALLLRYFCDLPVAQVASLLDCPEGTVKSLTFKAIRSLREQGIVPEGLEANNV